MDDNELNKSDMVVVPVVDVGYILIESEIHDVDDVIVDPDAEENFIDAPGEKNLCSLLQGWLRLETRMWPLIEHFIQKKEKRLCVLLKTVILEKYILKHWRRDITTCVEKKHKQIWREVEVHVPKPPSRKNGRCDL
ncbi:hypothetical protein Tco_0875666 [Tanacetum coccineum]|uniref:Uncharacterized protein n=1 Tax=Tanacetum coccineum TaxID=301880 RepID=A0ABQ5BQ28_9ASTR